MVPKGTFRTALSILRCVVLQNTAVGTFSGDLNNLKKLNNSIGGGGGVYSERVDSILISDSAFKSNEARGTQTVSNA